MIKKKNGVPNKLQRHCDVCRNRPHLVPIAGQLAMPKNNASLLNLGNLARRISRHSGGCADTVIPLFRCGVKPHPHDHTGCGAARWRATSCVVLAATRRTTNQPMGHRPSGTWSYLHICCEQSIVPVEMNVRSEDRMARDP